jgi:hypothetical protein
MFDEIPKPKKPRDSRERARLWIGLSVLWLVVGVWRIQRHDDFGWKLVTIYSVVLLISIGGLVLSRRGDAQEGNKPEK